MAQLKLSRRLFLLTTLALVPAALILLYNVALTRSDKEREVHGDALRLGQMASLEMQRIMFGAQNVLIAISSAPMVRNLDTVACSDYLALVRNRLPEFAGISVVDMDGTVRCSREINGLGTVLADRTYFQEAKASGELTIGTYTIGRISGRAGLPLAIPFGDDNGEMVGVIVATIDLEWLGQRLSERDFAANNALTIADREGTILARTPFPERFVGTKIPEAFRSVVQGDAPGTMEVTSQDGTRRIIGYYPVSVSPSGLYISAGIATENAYAAINRATRFGIGVTIAGLASAMLLAWITSRELIRKPVGRLVSTVSAWRSNDEMARTGMGETDGEFGIVGKAIDDFMDELVVSRRQRRRDEQQRELLTAELDHRVKNLLATVQSVARQSFKSGADPEAVDVFSRRLAAMGQAHTLLMKDQWQSTGIKALIDTALAPFDNPDASPFALTGPDFIVRSKVALALGMALHELCTNAAKYGALSVPEGKVAIDWSLDGAATDEQGEDQRIWSLVWRETGGPEVRPPPQTGFGSRMIERVLSAELSAEVTLDYHPEGLVCHLRAPYSALRPDMTQMDGV